MKIRHLGAVLLGVALTACGAATTTSSGGSTGAEITLTSCTTSLSASTASFYRAYFACLTASKTSSGTTLATTNLPPHRSYYYGASHPNYTAFDTSRGAEYQPNPNSIGTQSITVQIPDTPTARGLTITTALVDGTVGTNTNEYALGPVGVALDGVVLFNPLAAPGDDIDNEKFTFDTYNAHPNRDNVYHYHTSTPGPLEVMVARGFATTSTPGSAAIELYGMMCDGTVLLGCTELNGTAPDSSTFDAQNGHVHDIVDGSGTTHFASRYHTHLCPTQFTTHQYTPEIQYYDTCVVE